MNRQKLMLGGIVGLALFALLITLRSRPAEQVALGAAYEERDPQMVDEDPETASSRPRGSAVTRISASERPERNSATNHPVRLTRYAEKEDFQAQKERALGDSHVRGIVRGHDGKPLAGAQVELFENDPMTDNPPLRTVSTDKEGSYTLDQLNDNEKRYILVARAEGHAPEAMRVHLPHRPVRQDIRLTAGVAVSGLVLDALTSQPVAGAIVYHPSRGQEVWGVLGKVTSGPGGQFSFPQVRKGRVRTLATANGYRKALAAFPAPEEKAEITMVPGGATIRGVTVSRLTGKPVGGSKVVAKAGPFVASFLVGESGEFELGDLPGGEYEVYALRGDIPSESQKVQLSDQELKDGVKITVADNLFVHGRVEMAGSGEAVPGVQIWFKGPRGTDSAMSDEDGRFGFETVALNEYTLEVHEKNRLPVQDRKTSQAVETITRQVAEGASSDEVTIRLRRTRAVFGVVKANRGKNGKPGRIWGADVVVDYKVNDLYERVRTRTDSKGSFFVNLPNRRAGDARVMAIHQGMVDVEAARVPNRKPIELELKQTWFRGKLVLSDATPLSGVRIKTRNFLYPDKAPDSNFPLPGVTLHTGVGGGFNIPVGQKQKLEVAFHLPDEKVITKTFDTDQLTRRRLTLVYDPVEGDIVSDVDRPRPNRNRNGQQQNKPRPAQRPQGNQGQGGRPGGQAARPGNLPQNPAQPPQTGNPQSSSGAFRQPSPPVA